MRPCADPINPGCFQPQSKPAETAAMPHEPDKTVRRKDYRPPAWLAFRTRINFSLDPEATRVRTVIVFRRNPAVPEIEDLRLDGKGLKLVHASIDGACLDDAHLRRAENGLTVPKEILSGEEFLWQAETEISPVRNTSLDGLYMSKGMYCTQCEPEGFRRICHFPDRPDVLSRFTVRIESPQPVLLSNGNLVAAGDGFAEWHDPWPKPSYLFALVAGDLVSVNDSFTTTGGREVSLRIWVRRGDEGKCGYAMDALKRAMKWDEDNYGREYDLDQFNIVAVDDFNMGAMENKGLNIFNSKLVLASPDTATDDDYERIESVIAHEYFHNWTGNRVTCRDWFQLSLKEGLTVFRDRQFSSDQRSAAVVRIKDVRRLRTAQFPEDAGPLAHPVRPDAYREISNFYTATVYEKGAEVVSMLHQMAGAAAYRKAADLYFERHDGQACTIEDWIKAFEDVLHIDLSQFKLWYSQAGTPRIRWRSEFQNNELRLTFEQETAPTPGQDSKKPLTIPISAGLINESGGEIRPPGVLLLTGERQTFCFKDLPCRPKASILRGFSAPVILMTEQSNEDALFALRRDSDSFNRWDAGQRLLKKTLTGMIREQAEPDIEIIRALASLVADQSLDPAFRALMLELPPENEVRRTLAEAGHVLDPNAFHSAREELTDKIADSMSSGLARRCRELGDGAPYSSGSRAAGRRSLRLALLRLLCRIDGGTEAEKLYESADNMTEKIGAVRSLLSISKGEDQTADFYASWSGDRLVLDKWFAFQILEARPVAAVDLTLELTEHSDFEWMNPNRFRAVIAAFAFGNNAGFHSSDGRGYALLADWLIRIDAVNPQVAARHCAAFESRHLYDRNRQELMLRQMQRIRNSGNLSADSSEMLDRMMRAA